MDDDENKPSKIKDAAEAVAAMAKAVPIYQDAIQPGAKELGKSLETIGKTVNVALAPLKMVVWGYEHFEVFLNKDIAEKLKNTPEEDIITPKINVAGPLLDALRYSAEEDELREMFANLLANAMDKKTANSAHPSFVEILKQITSDEAKILKHFSVNIVEPVLEISSVNESDPENITHNVFLKPFSILGEICECEAPLMTPSYIENLNRLGLVNIRYDGALADESKYVPLLESEIAKIARQVVEDDGRIFSTEYGYVERSFFGSEFCKFCVIDKASQPPTTAP